MKIPAVAIAAAFSSGILLGLCAWLAGLVHAREFVYSLIIVCAAALCLGFHFVRRSFLLLGGATSLFA